MAVKKIEHPSVDERRARGLEARTPTPLSVHVGWAPATDRPDPVGLLQDQNRTREPDLVPVRHGRMQVSPFTFYRGAAKIMAADLKDTPTAGLQVQLCGDAWWRLCRGGLGAGAVPGARVESGGGRDDPGCGGTVPAGPPPYPAAGGSALQPAQVQHGPDHRGVQCSPAR
jgi:Uncharacterized protein conserved in bacteria (DUF2252)